MALINKLSAIGNAIREKTGKTDLLTLDQMPQEISSIETGGGDSYYDDMWDSIQENGNKTNYASAFLFTSWNDIVFKPKYDIKPSGSIATMFKQSKITNLAQILKDCGVVLDTSEVTNFNEWIQGSTITHLPCINCLGNTAATVQICYGASYLISIEKVVIDKSQTIATSAFNNCYNLEDIYEIEGQFGTSVSFRSSNLLSNETINRIINALTDLTGATAQTLTLHANVKAKLTETQIASITSKNWTLA